MMAKRDECIETDEYQSRVNAELEDLRIADDSDAERTTEVQMDAERAIGIKIMEEINQTLFTEIHGEYIAEKRGELAHERLLAIAERSLSEEGESLFTLRCKQASDKRSVVGKRA
ncbi:E3 ubiquitin-protein ligase SlrP [Salmonella enterica subsp. enterica]|nr:E3 ubiquitin-protein ligase SlrP [Salmonella enterica subsp. enterica]